MTSIPMIRHCLHLPVLLLLLLVSCRPAELPEPLPKPAPEVLAPNSHRDLLAYFDRQGYDWETLEEGVPPFILEKLPTDFHRLSAGPERKRAFFLSLLPMVLLLNEEILLERQELQELFRRYDQGEELSAGDLQRVAAAASGYRIDRDPLTDLKAREGLLSRVDALPPSLVLAQAATESAYGTSRFAQLGNNLFGERTFGGYAGLVPKERAQGATFKVRTFPTLLDSLRSYVTNLNTNPLYQPLRERRAELRSQGFHLRGTVLAEGLGSYSERSDAYIADIQKIIAVNRLSLLAKASLRQNHAPAPDTDPSPVTAPVAERPIPAIGQLVAPKAE